MSGRYAMLLSLSAALALMPEMVLPQPTERPDNLAVFYQLFDSLAVRLVRQLPGEQPMPCTLADAGDATSAAGLLRARTVKHLLERGNTVFSADSSATVLLHLRIRQHLLRCQVRYQRVQDSPPQAGWRRLVVAEAEVEAVEHPSRRTWLQDFYRSEFADTLRADEIRALEDPRFPFTIGRWPPRSLWSKMLEPLLLTVAAGAVVYALYALRTR